MSTPERPGDPTDSYWTSDVAIGDGRFYNETFAIRLALHEESERCFGRSEIFPLTANTGSRLFFHAKPYILIPDIRLEIGLYPQPRGEAIGEVHTVQWEGMRHEVVGNAQAWFYPQQRALVIWECFLHDRHRLANPLEDDNQQTIWTGLETLLVERLSGVEKLYTTWEDIYERSVWQRFLQQQEYQQVDRAAFLKEISRGGAISQ